MYESSVFFTFKENTVNQYDFANGAPAVGATFGSGCGAGGFAAFIPNAVKESL
jgi:hypothetical protein